jgi:hypothetical protein
MDYPPLDTFLQQVRELDPASLITCALIVVALALAWLALRLPARIRKLTRELRRAAERITIADEARRREATLEAVRRFESDPEVREALRRIWHKTEQATNFAMLTEKDRFDIITLLNYFDGIASGLKQGVLDEQVAKDYLRGIIHKIVKGLLRGESGPTWKAATPIVEPEGFENLLALQARWGMEDAQSIIEMLR